MHYKKVRLTKQQTKDEHRLLVEEKLGRLLFDFEVAHHIDGNKENNNPDNLCVLFSWCHKRLHALGKTKSAHTKELISLATRGINNASCKLSEDEVREIKALLLKGTMSQKDIAQMFDVSTNTICNIKHGRKWKHI